MIDARKFQIIFRRWLGENPDQAIKYLHEQTGYSIKYLQQVAGLVGRKPWPGSVRFIRKMTALGCSNRPWRDRTREQLAHAFATREVLIEGG